MTSIPRAASAALAIIAGMSVAGIGVAQAKECKTDVVTATGEPFAARSIGAYPSSLFAWRKAAEAKAGGGYQSWTVAEDKKVDCEQVNVAGKKRWVCTRSARPCKGFIGTAEKKPEFKRTLRRGDSGDDVKAMQFLLNDLGYELELDGNYGRLSQDAVRDFQNKNGLKADGNFGAGTAAKLLAVS